MKKSLLEQLPGIVAEGKRQAAQILEQLEGEQRVSLQTRELVVPRRDHAGLDLSQLHVGDVSAAEGPNRLIYGDNLLAMAALLAGDETNPSMRGKIDLVYIDPPFDSKADYRTSIKLPGLDIEQRPTVAEQFAYSDTWASGTASYLAMLTPRLVLLRELLRSDGTVYLHIDWHVAHYVKMVLDEVFGRENFLNEIVRAYAGGGQSSSFYPRKHDTLFFYKKSGAPYFDADSIRVPYESDYRATVFTAAGSRAAGKTYEPHPDGKVPEDWWVFNRPYGSEITGYSTQKPEALLERIGQRLCPEGTLLQISRGQSTTAAAVSERLGRRWIATDLGKPAIMITRKRLIDQDAKPFLYQEIGDYQVEQARSAFGRKFRVGDLAQTILGIYGALPLPPEENVNGSLGRLPEGNTLVLADSPSKLTTLTTLRKAQSYRDTKMGGFDRVVVLGWNFPAGVGQQIADLNDDRLEVRVIPPDLIDRLKKKGKGGLAGSITFSTLQYLEASLVGLYPGTDSDEATVKLDNYVLLSPEAISLKPEDRDKVLEVMNREPLALIEYWAIDPDYDGELFRSTWQDFRGNTANDDDPLRVVTRATVTVPKKPGPRKLCIRAVDVFGFESEVVVTLDGGAA
ncbi:MAG: site-specific DNA-methyltransferase [Cryobacterium sp.]|nr:site-specific DNA-methyltransferase [Cryobacterium sp.]